MTLAARNMRALPLLLAAGMLCQTAAAGARIKSDWSRVREVEPGTKVWVRLYKNETPKGRPRVVLGRFASAGADSVAIVLSDGKTAAFEKRAVRRVSVRRPARQRWPAGVAAGGMAAIDLALIRGVDAEDAAATLGILSLLTIAPVWAAVHFGMTGKPIYDAPEEQRTD